MEQRQVEIFNRIYSSEYPLKSTELSTILSVSERTIRNDIKTLNEFSNEKGYKIVRVKNQGYKVQLIDTEKFYTYFISGSHRVPCSKINDVDWIIYLLVCTSDFVSIDELAEQIFSSRSKVMSTIDLVSKTVKNYSLGIDIKTGKGIKIIGDEESKRSFLHHLLNQHKLEQMSLASTWYSKENYQCSLTYIKEIAQQWGLHFTDENLELIAFHFLITFNRLANGSALKVKQLQIDQIEQGFCNCLFEAHEKLFEQVLPKREKNYLASIILSKKDSPNKTNVSDEEAFLAVQQLVQSINQKYGYDFAYFLEPDSDFFLMSKECFIE